MLAKGIKATGNSDDPAYFRAYFPAYMNENLVTLTDEGNFSKDELVQLSRNAFNIAWRPEARRQHYLDQLQTYANT